jgi:molybdopterin converting factor small subunit
MQIKVKLFAHHRTGRFKEEILDYPVDASIGQIVATLGILPELTGMALRNGYPATLIETLQDGDTLAIFPLVSGG